jgi:hypothetical protein
MEACYGGTDVMERSCAVARGIDINNRLVSPSEFSASRFSRKISTWKHLFTVPSPPLWVFMKRPKGLT